MIMLTKEQLAGLLRQAHLIGAAWGACEGGVWVGSEAYLDARERAIQPLVHRSSGEASQPDCEVDK